MPAINPSPAEAPSTPTPPGPCDWPVDVSCCPDWASFDPAVQANGIAWATQILDALTGRRFSQCAVNYRPCGPSCSESFGYITWPVGSPVTSGGGLPWMIPYVDGGIWRNCTCSGGCSCRAACEIPFPTPLAEVLEVRIDGLTIDPSAYRTDIYRGVATLVRIDGECWPKCQDLNLEADEVGAFVIVYRPGELLPVAGRLAAGMLACEFAKSCAGQDCALPAQLQSLSRNGVEVQVVDPQLLLDNGLTGVAMVDLWVRSVNPFRRAARSRVYSGDVPSPRFTV